MQTLEANITQPVSCLGSSAWLRMLQAGETLFLEGSNPTSLYQVQSGCVKLTTNSSAGRETVSELLLPGDIFDLPSCLDGLPHLFSSKAPSSTAARVWVISRGALLEDPQLSWRCQAQFMRQLRQIRSHPVTAPADRVEVRFARALLWLGERLGVQTEEGLTFPLWLTRQELSEWVGTSPETVIRVCSDLRRRGLIRIDKGSLTLLRSSELHHLTEAA